VETKEIIRKIEEERKVSLRKTLEIEIGQGLVRVLEEGKTLVPVSEDQIVVSKEEVEKIASLAIPPGHVPIPKEVADIAKSILSEDKVVVDKEEYKKLLESKPVGEDKIVIPKSKYEQLVASYGLPTIDSLKSSEEVDLLQVLKMLLLALKPPFGFTLQGSKNKKVQEYISSGKVIVVKDIAKALGMSTSVTKPYYKLRALYFDTYFGKALTLEAARKAWIYWVSDIAVKQIEKQLGEEYCNYVFKYCAEKIYPVLPNLPWRDEVRKLVEKNLILGFSENQEQE
jgi:phage pi2 protein 07